MWVDNPPKWQMQLAVGITRGESVTSASLACRDKAEMRQEWPANLWASERSVLRALFALVFDSALWWRFQE
ncbi:hypothetical protein AERO9AM_20799 [Aeromicrobium sp. 9AM]|nr:hypothetical protein AERO9AM_20799 [Aeromicrobium sp. 9AM]